MHAPAAAGLTYATSVLFLSQEIQHGQCHLCISFAAGKAFTQRVDASGLCNQIQLRDQQMELRRGQLWVRGGVQHQAVGLREVLGFFFFKFCFGLFGQTFDFFV